MAATIDTSFLQDLAPSLGVMLRRRVAKTPDREAYRFLRGADWVSVTWSEAAAEVAEVAAGLLALRLRREDRVAIVANTRYEWILADLAVMCAGGATTTVYPTTAAEDAAYILADAGCRFAIVEDADQLAKIMSHRGDLPALETIIAMDAAPGALSLDDVRRRGRELLAADPEAVNRATDAIGQGDLATLIYTSGTTGRPKGVRLTQLCWVYEGEALKALGFLRTDDVNFLWLPMSHSFGKVILSAQLAVGYATAIDGRVDKIIDNLAVIKPTFMGAAPRIFEKAYGKIVSTQEAEGGLKEKIFRTAFAVGAEYERRKAAGERIGAGLALRHRLFDRLVFAKVRERFGGRVRFFISGSAPLNREIAEWFHSAGILIIEGYGLTETTAGAFCGRPIDNKFGTVGRALPGSDVRIAPDGEIQLRGPHIMSGYNNLETETADAFTPDGWLRTGDQGTLDADGFLTITGRLKDLIKTSGGKIVVPGAVEAAFKALCPYVSQFLVFGDERPYCVALVTLDPDAIAAWCAENGVAAAGYSAQVSSPEVQQLVAGYIDQLNGRLNPWETVKRWTILDADLSIESGELTPSMKVKRGLVEQGQRERIGAMYAG
ncbi:AMP-binding protein [Microbacterium sp. Sa4CUA7]|uniref:Acyl-CoA synthetase n=1 Tax=Microbacterium pullorum TaxID=2762236 RepID=A0ABR8S3P9_9MICO|nr:AMP-dependent synthetase/ligase [Microbacterium pullorum]MBD7958112.1 AMP-binding protein [Microbacterium pullorum]